MFNFRKFFKTKKNVKIKDVRKKRRRFIRKTAVNRIVAKIMKLPAEPIWYITIMVINYIRVIGSLYLSENGKCVDYTNKYQTGDVFYCLDILYCIDIIFAIAILYVKNVDMYQKNLSRRPLGVVVADVLSVIPCELFVSKTLQNDRLFCMLKLNRCFTLIRLIQFSFFQQNLLDSKIYERILEVLASIVILSMALFSGYCNVHCLLEQCEEDDACNDFNFCLTMTISKITCSGFSHCVHNFEWELLCTPLQLIALTVVIAFAISNLTITLINLNLHQESYINMFKVTLNRYANLGAPEAIMSTAAETFNMFWKMQGGYDCNLKILQKLLPGIKKELLLELNWSALQHSKTFKSMDIMFLSCLANRMKRKFIAPGEYIYKKDQPKSKLIYVVSGTIQILSEEDGESPILSLGSGTCLGVPSLITSYKSSATVRCGTPCTICILKKKSFIQAVKRYPDSYKSVRLLILERFEEAKNLQEIAVEVKSKSHCIPRPVDTTTILWIKNTLHKHMAENSDLGFRHNLDNIYLVNELNLKELDKYSFTAEHLDLLAIKERIDTEANSVFVRTEFPFIFQPDSILVKIWEAIVIFFTLLAFFLITNAAFVTKEQTLILQFTVILVTLIFWWDIYMRLATAARTRYGITTSFTATTIVRIQTLGFWVDLLSCVPCEILSCILFEKITDQYISRMFLNRLLKLWRVEKMFQKWERKFNANKIVIRSIKYVLVYILGTYALYCVLYDVLGAINEQILFATVQMVTRIGFIHKEFYSADLAFVIADIIGIFFATLMYGQLGSALVLSQQNLLHAQRICLNLSHVLKAKNLEAQYYERVQNYVYTQWDENECLSLKGEAERLGTRVKKVHRYFSIVIGRTVLKTLDFFKGLSDELLNNICMCGRFDIYPPNETLTYMGDVGKEIYIIFKGSLEVRNGKGESEQLIERVHAFNLVEHFFDIPTTVTSVTKTHCMCLVIPRYDFGQILKTFADDFQTISNVVFASSHIKAALKERIKEDYDYRVSHSSLVNKSFFTFSYYMQENSDEEYDYYVPFDQIYPFSFLQYALMRTTVLPDGKFIYVWEIFRCIFAVLTAVLFFTFPIIRSEYYRCVYLLDLAGLIDIYLRFHVCYYDDKGLLITHPLYTATYYFRHSFLVDLLSILPIGFFFSQDQFIYIILNLNKFLQMHRYVGFCKVFYYRMTPVNKFYGLTFIPYVIVLANYLGCFLISMKCSFPNFRTETTRSTMQCDENSILSVSSFDKPYHSMRAHLYGVYIATSTLTTIGAQGFEVKTLEEENILNAFSIIGLALTTFIIGRMLALYSIRNHRLLQWQNSMKLLKNFFKTISVSPYLTKAIIDSYELKWDRLKGNDINKMMDSFNEKLRFDVMYDLYGKDLYETSVFASKSKGFFRNLAARTKYDIIMKNGYLDTINNVSGQMQFLYKGSVDVIAADGMKLATLLPGCIFGNLQNASQSRSLVSIVANCHAEVLSIEATSFYQLLQHYREIRKEFVLLKVKYVSYIPSYRATQVGDSAGTSNVFLQTFNPYSKGMKCWNAFNLIYSCYFCIMLDLYQTVSAEFSNYVIFLQYMADILYSVHFLFSERTAYEDETGILVTDLDLIRQERRKNKFKFWITIISLVPADVVVISLPIEETLQMRLYGIFRLNRLLRLTYLFEYFFSSSNKLNVRLDLMRFTFIALWTSVSINGLACLMAVFSCSFDVNIEPTIPSCHDLLLMTSFQKFQFYVKFVYISVSYITYTSIHNYYPQGAWHILLFITIMLLCQNLRMVCISQIFSTLYEWNFSKYVYIKFVTKLMFIARLEELSDPLLDRLQNYVEQLWIGEKGEPYPVLLENAPSYLQDAIMNDAFSHLITKHPIFTGCHRDFLRQVVHKLTCRTYYAGNYVSFKGDIDESMYFIYCGEVILLRDETVYKDDIFRTLGPGDSFAVMQGLYQNLQHSYTYHVTKTTILLTLEFNRWSYLLDFFPASKNQIYEGASAYVGI